MEPGVVLMAAETPSFPFDLVPTGQLGILFVPGLFANSSLMVLRCFVKTKLVPLPSARTTTLMSLSGSFTPGLVDDDLGIIPLGDLSEEDAHVGVAREFQVVHAFEVVGQDDAAGRHGQQLHARVDLGDFLGGHGGVAGAEVDRLVLHGLHARAAADRLVVDLHVGMGVVVRLEPLVV